MNATVHRKSLRVPSNLALLTFNSQTVKTRYSTSSGFRLIISKLSLNLRNKCTTRAARYQNQYQVAFHPPLKLLLFIMETAKTMNNPCFNYDTPSAYVGNARKILVNTKKTDTRDE